MNDAADGVPSVGDAGEHWGRRGETDGSTAEAGPEAGFLLAVEILVLVAVALAQFAFATVEGV